MNELQHLVVSSVSIIRENVKSEVECADAGTNPKV